MYSKELYLVQYICQSLPAPTTLSMDILEASSSLANSCTAWLGSSYVCGST